MKSIRFIIIAVIVLSSLYSCFDWLGVRPKISPEEVTVDGNAQTVSFKVENKVNIQNVFIREVKEYKVLDKSGNVINSENIMLPIDTVKTEVYSAYGSDTNKDLYIELSENNSGQDRYFHIRFCALPPDGEASVWIVQHSN